MTHPLDGARLKVVRAEKHLNSLKQEVRRYLDEKPYEFIAEQNDGVMTASSAVIRREPPLDFGCDCGDCLDNLRKSLDYIAWELAGKYVGRALVEGKDIIYFPLAQDAAGFSKNARPKLEKYAIPAAALDLMESVQPYHAGYESLGLLAILGNQEKHRLPLMTVAFADTTSIQVSVTGAPIRELHMRPPGSQAIVMGANVTHMIVRRLTPEDLANPPDDMAKIMALTAAAEKAAGPAPAEQAPSCVKVDGQVTVTVTLQNSPVPNEPVDRTLEKIVKCVANIVPRFERFF